MTVVAALFVVLSPLSASAAPPAAYTGTNNTFDGGDHCLNGQPNPVNCNLYDGKQYVWLNGGPSIADLGDGDFFFAVLDPGGQNSPNDGTTGNLSDDFDAYTNRTFTSSGGTLSTSGSHTLDSNKIRLIDYADTTNPGGVYILAICSLANGYPVTPRTCKYDAFKVKETTGNLNGLLSASKDVTPSFTRAFGWKIAKDVDQTEIHQSGTKATFNYTVVATKDEGSDSLFALKGTIYVVNDAAGGAASNIEVSDTPAFDPDAGESATCTIFDPTNTSDEYVQGSASLPAGSGELDFPYSCTLGGASAATAGLNSATVNWTNSDNSPDSTVSPPAVFDFATATPSTVDNCTDVDDTLGGTLGNTCETKTFTYSYEVEGKSGTCVDQDNKATFTTSDTKTTDSASQSVKLCVGADLTVSKTADTSYTRTYGWKIDKSVDKTTVNQVGGTATFKYTVQVDQTSPVDSLVQAAGLITVTNPNDWEDITADVTDAVDNGGNCSVVDGDAVVVPRSSSVDVAYTCTYAALAAPGTNTGTAKWDADAASTPKSEASGTAPVAFGAPTIEVNKTITVKDSFKGVLGTVTATDSVPYASQAFEYSRTVNVPTNGCVTYDNTATITETGQNDSASVKVCGPVHTGALTMGFWQNKNGQAIITGQAKTGVCPSTTWLRQFAPFYETALSATATCAQVGTYVTNIIKAANASGASMNAMLKAQMLATALDVYFSDPLLGGNKIGAPAPIGGIVIDLTKVCSNPLTCSTYINTSGAFNGATSMTVSQLLAYAASQSNLGGSVWYGNVKATQELAKDTFDAINNEVAFGA